MPCLYNFNMTKSGFAVIMLSSISIPGHTNSSRSE